MAEESPVNEFKTISTFGESLFKDKGSKFIGLAHAVKSEEEVREKLDEIKKQYYDARHHCYAYILGLKDQAYRANDDGEPNHSAGGSNIGSNSLRRTDQCSCGGCEVFWWAQNWVLVGLISAYKTAAEEALSKTSKKFIYSKTTFKLTFEYPQTSEVERVLSEFDVEYHQKDYTAQCHFLASVKDEDVSLLTKKMEVIADVKLELV